MDIKGALPDQDCNDFSDEQLIELIRVFDCMGALEALLKRGEEWTRAIVLYYQPAPWNDEDFAEAMQSGRMAARRAIKLYRLAEIHKEDGVKFRTFFGTIVGRDVSNFFRGRARYECHLDRKTRAHDELVCRAEHPHPLGEDFLLCHTEPSDPEQLAELHEFRERLEDVVSHLEGMEAGLWREICNERTVSAAARQLGIEEAEARRIWAQLLAKVYRELKDVGPSVAE